MANTLGQECRRPRHHGRQAPRTEERRPLCRRRHHQAGRAERGAPGHGRYGDRPQRADRAAGFRQHPPPSQPDADAQSSRRAEQQSLSLAEGALPHLGAHRRGGLARQHADRAGGAGALRLHDGLRPQLRLQERQQRGLPDRGRERAGRALSRQPRLDVARRIEGRLAAGRLRRGRGLHPEGQPARHRDATTTRPWAR